MAKSYIKLWDSYESYFKPLSAAEVGRLVLAMMKYKSSGTEPELIGNEKYVWPAIMRDLNEDAEYTEKKSSARKTDEPVFDCENENQNESKQNKRNQNKTGNRTKEKEKEKESSSSCDGMTTTKSIEDVFREDIGKLGATGERQLREYAGRMGDELVMAVIQKCADLGGKTWAYVRKALDEAESFGCKTADDYRRVCPIGSGRNLRVDRQEPSGNDWLKNAALNRSLGRLKKETA